MRFDIAESTHLALYGAHCRAAVEAERKFCVKKKKDEKMFANCVTVLRSHNTVVERNCLDISQHCC